MAAAPLPAVDAQEPGGLVTPGQGGFIDAILAESDPTACPIHLAIFADWLSDRDRPRTAGRLRLLADLCGRTAAFTLAGLPAAPPGPWYEAVSAARAMRDLDIAAGRAAVDLYRYLCVRHLRLVSGGTLLGLAAAPGTGCAGPDAAAAAALLALAWAGVVPRSAAEYFRGRAAGVNDRVIAASNTAVQSGTGVPDLPGLATRCVLQFLTDCAEPMAGCCAGYYDADLYHLEYLRLGSTEPGGWPPPGERGRPEAGSSLWAAGLARALPAWLAAAP